MGETNTALYKSKRGGYKRLYIKATRGTRRKKSRPEASGRQIWKSEKKTGRRAFVGTNERKKAKKESSRQPTGCMSRGSEDESLTANTEHTAFLCLYYHIPEIRSTNFKKNIKRCNATPPRAPFSASGEPTGSSSARQRVLHPPGKGATYKKMSRHKRLPNAGNTSAAKPPRAIAPQWGEPTGPSSARQGRHIQKNERAISGTLQRESTETPEGVPSVGLRRKRLARPAGFDALKERQHKNST